jgi:hypothetical protein
MRHVPPPLAELTAHAQILTSAGDLMAARAVLVDALDPTDADPQRASPDLADAATLLARILIALGDPHTARIWAAFAHAAEDRLYGPHDERTVAAAALHAAVLHRVGNFGRAAQLYHDLVGELTALDGRDSARVLAAEADLATAEHAAGHCTAARGRLTDAWTRFRQVYGDAGPSGIKMLARLGAMERECGRTAESREHLALVQELCARYLPGDHPLAVQAANLAQAPAGGRHICGRVERSSGPATAPGVTPVHRPAAPGIRRVRVDRFSDGQYPDASPGADDEYPDAAASAAAAGPYARAPHRAYPDSPWDPPRAVAATPAGDPAPPAADDRTTEPKGLYQQPIYLADVHQAPGERTGRHVLADTPSPLPGRRPPENGPDGRPIGIGAAPVLPPAKVTPPDSRLPVPVPVEKPAPRGSWQPLVLVAVLIAGVAVAAAVVIMALPNASGQVTPPASRPPASAAAPARASTSASASVKPSGLDAGPPPGAVRLRDNRDSVSLDWNYPKGAEGPVLISGGRRGQEQRAFQQLPAGSTNYVVYGLNEGLDYCFSVAVVYTVDHVAASKPLCTHRG